MKANDPMVPRPVIVGLGITETGNVFGRSASDFAADAVRRAVADAGLDIADVDGLLVSAGQSGGVSIWLARQLGLGNLGLLSQISQAGSTAAAQVQLAALAIAGGLATTIVCVHADAPLQPTVRAGSAYRQEAGDAVVGISDLRVIHGPRNASTAYALAARRHMSHYGTTSEQLGAIAVAQRAWAASNPLARFREPITVADHQASRWVAHPLHLLDCCMVSNGGIAVVVTAADRAANLAQPPVHIWGWGQTHPEYRLERGSRWGLETGAAIAGPAAMAMAGVSPSDIDIRELYDCYTYTALVTLEDYGFCQKGEGGPLAESGALGPGGSLPTNTGGGQLSSYYLWGMTPLSEAIIQLRGQGGDRQVPRHEVAIVSGNGGILDFHSTLVLGAQAR